MSNTRYMNVVAAARETVAKILSRREGQFQVTVNTDGGNTASVYRNGNDVVLCLPSMAADTMLSRSAADTFVAYIGHEMCHVLHTDWTVKPSELPKRVMAWANALEDVRIEAKELNEGPFKGLKGLIESLSLAKYAEAHAMLAARGDTLGADVLNAPYVTTLLGRMANGYSLPPVEPLKSQLTAPVRRVVEFALANLSTCKSTQDCVALAQKLVVMEGDLGQGGGTGNPASAGKPQDGQQGQPGQDQGQGQNATGKPSDGPEGKSEGEGKDPQGQDAKGEGKGEDGSGKTPGGNGAGGKEISAELTLDSTVKTVSQDNPKAFSTHSAALNNISATTRQENPSANIPAQAALDAAMVSNSVLHGQIARLLVSEERNQRTHHETSGRLDRRALVRMRTGAGDVFSRRDYMPGNDTAVMILVDCSGSMRHDRMATAQAAAWAIAKAAEAAGGKLAIMGFYGGRNSVRLTLVKDFGQQANTAAGAIHGLQATSYTPLSAAIITASQAMADVQATRRIIMVLTDGMCDLGPRAVQMACRIAGDHGVETVGIGIQCEAVTAAFPSDYSVCVNDLQQLATTGLGALVTMLEDAAGEAA